MDERERRMAQNEVLFREVNERVDEMADGLRGLEHTEYLCECANSACTFRVELTRREYESVRADPTQFVVLPQHQTPEVEELVVATDRYWVVRKIGEAGDYAEALDPRSRGEAAPER